MLTLWANAVDEGDDHVQAGRRRQRVLSQPLDRVDIALPHDAHAHQQEQHHHHDQRDQKTAHLPNSPSAKPRMLAGGRWGARRNCRELGKALPWLAPTRIQLHRSHSHDCRQ